MEYVDRVARARYVDHPSLAQDMDANLSDTEPDTRKRLLVSGLRSPLNRIQLEPRLAARLCRKSPQVIEARTKEEQRFHGRQIYKNLYNNASANPRHPREGFIVLTKLCMPLGYDAAWLTE